VITRDASSSSSSAYGSICVSWQSCAPTLP
jgi:hypothetical protein